MAGFTRDPVKFSARLDSKGRITVPARIRNKLDLEKGEKISLSLDPEKLVMEEVGSYQEALEFIRSLEKVTSFCYRDGVVEVVIDG